MTKQERETIKEVEYFFKQFRQGVFAEEQGSHAVLNRVEELGIGCWFDEESTRLLARVKAMLGEARP